MNEELQMLEVNPVKDFTLNNWDIINRDTNNLRIEDDVIALNELRYKIASLESYKQMLSDTKACCKEDYDILISLGVSQESMPNKNGYTKFKSTTNLDETLRAIGEKAKQYSLKLYNFVVKLIQSVWLTFKTLMNRFSAIENHLNILHKNAEKLQKSLDSALSDKMEFNQLTSLNPEDYNLIIKRVTDYLGQHDIKVDLNDIRNNNLEYIFAIVSKSVIGKYINGVISDSLTDKKVFTTLEHFVTIDASNFIYEINNFVNTENPKETPTRNYDSKLPIVYKQDVFSNDDNNISLELVNLCRTLEMQQGKFDLEHFYLADINGLTFISMISKGNMHDFFNKKRLDKLISDLKSKNSANTGISKAEMNEEYVETFDNFMNSLTAVQRIIECLHVYNESLIKLIKNADLTVKFQVDLLNYLNSKY